MKKLLAVILGLSLVGCSTPQYTFTLYEHGVQKARVGVDIPLQETMIIIRDNKTGNWALVPGSVVAAKLYPSRLVVTTQPSN